MDISYLIVGAALALYGLGALMDRNAHRAQRERRYPRIPR
ncbi:hypothetical protein OKW50_007729 [Paraburkholderia youngii]|uniref:Uncharacterized protein n=1 Tax=Paraburkholderia atlantica TaxID=2654982 RepID=A0A7W8QF89_PARAM|nr:hypothetical protein [Paraburkholderia atlantica]MBB5511291.1 hypothetical protein [Paraburkholderia atlantica]